jgi:DNA-binding PadR family transcriptional regulator
VKKLTTTSYAILGLLALRPWSAYELANQMERSLHFVWPRAESKLYEEPKNLVEHGLATVRTEHQGRRSRTVYSITPQGQVALQAWLSLPGAGPVLEFEGLLKVVFAEHGSKNQLLANLRAIRLEAERILQFGARLAHEYFDHKGPFPERLHIHALVWRFLWESTKARLDWAIWAEAQVEQWPDTQPGFEKEGWGLEIVRQTLLDHGVDHEVERES